MADGSARMEIIAVGAREGHDMIEPLLPRHQAEVGKFIDISVIKADLPRYEQLERDGRFFGLVAREGREIVGYSANFLATNVHYSDLFFCQNDVLYVVPERRNSRVGLALIRTTMRIAKSLEAQLMLWHAKPGTSLDRLLPRMKFEVLDIIYAKRL